MKEIEESGYKRIPLEILNHFADFCESRSIKYSLAYGTVLGAVRHKGYIPWDDDIDVFMIRSEYNRFRDIYYSERYPFVDLITDKHHPVEMGKLYDSSTVIRTYGMKYRKYGLFVDVIPVDNVPSDEDERRRWLQRINFFMKLNHIINSSERHSSRFRQIVSIVLRNLHISSMVHFKIEKLFCKYNNVKTELVGAPCFCKNNKMKVYPSRIFNGYTKIEFEKKQFMVMSGYEEFLRICYKDYMKLPPENQRIGPHIITAFYKD